MHALMQKASEQMYVPEDKVAAFEKDGWTVIQKATGEQPATPPATLEKLEAVEETARKKPKKESG